VRNWPIIRLDTKICIHFKFGLFCAHRIHFGLGLADIPSTAPIGIFHRKAVRLAELTDILRPSKGHRQLAVVPAVTFARQEVKKVAADNQPTMEEECSEIMFNKWEGQMEMGQRQ
jgi:DMSO/TMAO reductase YedYZ molybdopterin-dependent catalytic subunit